MTNLVRLISWNYFRKHAVRTALTTVGIALGVTVFVGMHVANDNVLAAFSETVDRIAGKTELQITAGEAGFGEDVLERVQAVPTVRVAVPIIEAVADSNIRGEGKLLVLGVDMTGDQSLRDYDFDTSDGVVIDDPLIFLAQPDSMILSKEFADRNKIARGASLRLGTAEGERSFKVRGIVKSTGLMTAFGGNLAIMDIFAAQKMFGRGRTFDRIEVARKAGVSLADCRRQIEQILGPAFTVQPPSSRTQQFETILAGYSMIVDVSSAFALFVGIFIIYNAFAIVVTQRRYEIAMLRALGATRGHIRSLFLIESTILGLIGSAVGVVVGLLAAHAIAGSIGSMLGDIYGIAQSGVDQPVNPWLLAMSVAVGTAASVVAAIIPARQAAAVDPIIALQKGRYQTLSAPENRLRLAIAAGLVALLIIGAFITRAQLIPIAALVMTIFIALLLGPQLARTAATLMRPLLRRCRPVEGTLAADSLVQTPRRTSATVAALMLSIALVVTFSGIAQATYESLVTWMTTTLNPDLFVMPSQNLDVQSTRFPAAMGPEIAAIPGVKRVQLLRNARVLFRGTPVMVNAIEMTSVAQTDLREPLQGDRESMYRLASTGEGAFISDNLARLQHLRAGDMLEIPAPYGAIRLPVVAVVLDYSDQQGSIFVDRQVYIQHWHDDSVNVVRVYADQPGHVPVVRQAIIDRYAGVRQVFVMTNQQVKSYVVGVIGQWFSLTTVQVILGIVVAVLGILNTMTVSITDRRREFGILRAVGGFRGQVRRTIWIEAVSISAIAIVFGLTLGAIDLYYALHIVRENAGMALTYRFPFRIALMLTPLILASGFVAAIWPAEAGVGGSVVEALEYE